MTKSVQCLVLLFWYKEVRLYDEHQIFIFLPLINNSVTNGWSFYRWSYPHILHNPSKHWIVNQLIEVLLKIILCFCLEFRGHIFVWFQPCFLINSINLWTFSNISPCSSAYFKVLMCMTYQCSCHTDYTRTFHLSIFILLGKNGRLLFFLHFFRIINIDVKYVSFVTVYIIILYKYFI